MTATVVCVDCDWSVDVDPDEWPPPYCHDCGSATDLELDVVDLDPEETLSGPV